LEAGHDAAVCRAPHYTGVGAAITCFMRLKDAIAAPRRLFKGKVHGEDKSKRPRNGKACRIFECLQASVYSKESMPK
jgi:hypothetical protein